MKRKRRDIAIAPAYWRLTIDVKISFYSKHVTHLGNTKYVCAEDRHLSQPDTGAGKCKPHRPNAESRSTAGAVGPASQNVAEAT